MRRADVHPMQEVVWKGDGQVYTVREVSESITDDGRSTWTAIITRPAIVASRTAPWQLVAVVVEDPAGLELA